MAARGTFDSKRAQARELFDEGLSCRAIAKALGVSSSTISRWAKDEGLLFPERAKTAVATAVREFNMLDARIRLAEKMTANADQALDGLNGTYRVWSFGGKDNIFREHMLPEAPVAARREAQTVSAIAFDKLTKALEKSTNELSGAHSLLDALAHGFEMAATEYESNLSDAE